MVAALGLLALAALVRMVAALVEALPLMLLALIAAALVMPRHWRRHWRSLRQQAAVWLYTAAQTLGSVRPPQAEPSGQDHPHK